MGRLVNVVLSDGKVVSVPAELAAKINTSETAHPEGVAEAGVRETNTINEERSAGVGEGLKASLEGFADTATLGAYGHVAGALDEDYGRNAQIRAQERPGARLAGSLAAVLAPTGLLGETAAGASAALPINVLAAGAKGLTTGVAAGRLAEGAVYGAGGYLADSNVTGDPLSVEGVVQAAGIGAILNYGIGKVTDKLTGVSKAVIADTEAASKTKNLESFFDSQPETYNELANTYKDTVKAAKAAQREYDKAIEKYATDYHDFAIDPANTRAAIDQLGKLETDILSQAKGKLKSLDTPIKIEPGATQRAARLSADEVTKLEQAKEVITTARTKAIKAWKDGNIPDAMSAMESGIAEAKVHLPEATFPEIPTSAVGTARPTVPEIEKLPSSVKGLARLDPRTIAKIANTVEEGTPLAAAIAKFTQDTGLELSATAAETLAGTHTALSDSLKALGKSESSAGAYKGPGLLDVLKSHTNRSLKYAAGRSADSAVGGGPFGAIVKVMTGATAGYALHGVEGAMLGATFMSGKTTARANMNGIFAKYGQGVANVLGKLGTVTSYLSSSFPDGKPDTATDIRTLALNRINDLQAAAHGASDASFSALQPLMDAPGDVAFKIHALINNAIGYINQAAPKDAGIATNMFQSYWKPTHSEAVKLAHVMEAALSPMSALARLVNGKSIPEASDALWTMWPAHMAEAANAMLDNIQDYAKLSRQQSDNLSKVFRIPLNGFQQPEVVMQLQSLYLPQASGNEPSKPPSKQPTGNNPGRPPAVGGGYNANTMLLTQIQKLIH